MKLLNKNEKFNWFFNEAIELMTIPIAIIAIIIGVYSDVIDDNVFRDPDTSLYKMLCLKTYNDEFKRQLDLKDTLNVNPYKIEWTEGNSIKFNHIVVVDLTSSAFGKKFDDNYKKFKNSVKAKIKSTEDKDYKTLTIANLLDEAYIHRNYINELYFSTYVGSKKQKLKPIKINGFEGWQSLNSHYICNIKKTELKSIILRDEKQVTDFNAICSEIDSLISGKENVIITLISDFYHDLNKKVDFKGLKSNKSIKKINVISLPYALSSQKSGYFLKDQLFENFGSNKLNYSEVDITDYLDGNINPPVMDDFFFKISSTLSKTTYIKDAPIEFYHPNLNSVGQYESKREIHINGIDSIYWKISNHYSTNNLTNSYIGNYTNIKDSTAIMFKSNTWYLGFKENDKIKFCIQNRVNNYDIDFYDKKNNIIKKYNVKMVKTIPKFMLETIIWSIRSLVFLFTLFLLSHLLKNVFYLRKSTTTELSFSFYFFEIGLIIISGFTFFLLAYDWWHLSYLIIIIHLLILIGAMKKDSLKKGENA